MESFINTINRNALSTLKEFFKIYGIGFFLAIIILTITYQFVEPAPPYSLTIASGSADGAYYKYAQEYRKHFAKEKIDLTVLKTSGSVENLELLKNGKADVAFVQGGIARGKDFPSLRGLASLYLEPLLIFTRKEAGIDSIKKLAGKRVAIGPEGSGTRAIALQVLADNKLNDEDVELLALGGKEAARLLSSGEIDGLFVVTQVETELIHSLFMQNDIELMNLHRAESYSRLHGFLSHIVLPEGVIDMAANIPSEDIHFIAPAATLVIQEDLHPALIDLLMQISSSVHKEGSLFSDNTFPSPDKLDFPLSKEAGRFYKNGPSFLQRYLPFWAATLADRLKVMLLPLIALILPLAKILPPTYRWRIRSRIYRWYDELHELDNETRKSGSPDVINRSIEQLNAMENEVLQIEVPLSYAEELYNLRLHIDLLRRQMEEVQQHSAPSEH